MNQNVRWHVVFTKQHCERKVVLALTNKGYQCYCPHHTVSALWKTQDKPAQKPLFSSYVFVRCTQEQFSDIKKTPGIINFMYRLDQPAVVTKEDMAAIRHAIGNYTKLQIIKSGLHTTLHPTTQEPDSHAYPLHSLGITLIALQKNLVTNTPVLTGESKRAFPRLSYRFKLAWR
ncbi:MAG TPA: UpxY family transcription antiterminator [Flavisolibacter sp.]|jgi:transcription antitermination factor NusG|nr:UpxY family transcription antiterminator [Flavisolibacter sp.]